MEANLKEKCLICRQKNWLKIKVDKKLPNEKIVPISKNEDNNNNFEFEKLFICMDIFISWYM